MKAMGFKESMALLLAAFGHLGQVRKYTGAPYINHPLEVVEILRTISPDVNMLCAAWMHDLVEDTWVPLWLIRILFGSDVASLVQQLTDVSKPTDGNRAYRKLIDRHHAAHASRRGQTIKYADMIGNMTTIIQHDPKFAPTYLKEKRDLLKLATLGDEALYWRAWHLANSDQVKE